MDVIKNIRGFFKRSDSDSPSENNIQKNPTIFNLKTLLGYTTDLDPKGLSAFFACSDLISSDIATLDIDVEEIRGGKVKRVVSNHDFCRLFEKTSYSKFMLLKGIITDVINWGNSYLYIKRDEYGTPLSIEHLESNAVIPQYDSRQELVSYLLTKYNINVEPINIVHFYMWKPYSWSKEGIPLEKYMKRTLLTSIASEEQSKEFFANGCNMNGYFKPNIPLSEDQREELSNNWNYAYGKNGGGITNVPIINENVDFVRMSIDAKDAQMLESRVFNIKEVCRFFRVPPSKIGENDGMNTTEVEQIYLNTIRSWIKMIEDAINKKFDLDGVYRVIFNEDKLLRTNKKDQAEYFTKLAEKGILSINEIREELGYEPIKEGDKHIIAYTDINQNTIGNKKEDEKENKEENEDGKGN